MAKSLTEQIAKAWFEGPDFDPKYHTSWEETPDEDKQYFRDSAAHVVRSLSLTKGAGHNGNGPIQPKKSK